MGYEFGDATIDQYASFLKSYWHMEETGAANRVDVIGGHNAVPGNSPANRVGKSNNACDFIPGSQHYLTAPHHADLSPTSSFAVSEWVYHDVGDANKTHLNKGPSSSRSFTIGRTGDMVFQIWQSNDTVKSCIEDTPGSEPPIGSWVNVVSIADGSHIWLYLNTVGASFAQGVAYDGTIKQVATGLSFGRFSDIGHYFDGGMDEVAFWNGITFANQAAREAFVAALWNSGSGIFLHLVAESVLERTSAGLLLRTAGGVLERT